MKTKWVEVFDISDIYDTIEIIVLLEEGKDFSFVSTTRGGKGKVYKFRENGKEYVSISSESIGNYTPPKSIRKIPKYRHTVLKQDAVQELETIVVEKRL